MFSVIMPLYNKAPYVEKAVGSVLAQTFKDFELIVVDDGSTDNSLEIVQSVALDEVEVFKTSKIQIIEQKNAGVSTARNNGVKLAKYDYITFLDADDCWDEHFLEEMKCLIEKFPEAAMYGCSYYLLKNGQNKIAPIALPENFEAGYIDYIKVYSERLCMPITSITAVLRKTAFDETGGFKPQLRLGEDFDVWLRIALKHKVAFVNKPLAYYNQDVDLQNRGVQRLRNPQENMLWHLQDFENQADKTPYLKQLLDNLRVYSLFPYFLDKNYRETAKTELAKIDWTKQPKAAKRRYEMPVWLLKLRWQIQTTGSKCKTFFKKIMRK